MITCINEHKVKFALNIQKNVTYVRNVSGSEYLDTGTGQICVPPDPWQPYWSEMKVVT